MSSFPDQEPPKLLPNIVEEFKTECDICGATLQCDPDFYAGKYIKRYQITICKSCCGVNWDGWAPCYEPLFERLLNKKNIPKPKRNAKGLYPLE